MDSNTSDKNSAGQAQALDSGDLLAALDTLCDIVDELANAAYMADGIDRDKRDALRLDIWEVQRVISEARSANVLDEPRGQSADKLKS